MKRTYSLLSLIAVSVLLSACASKKTASCAKPPRGYYCVKSGDTLSHISQRSGVTVSDLRSWNKLKSDTIIIGQVLQVSKSARLGARKEFTNNTDTAQPTPVYESTINQMQLPVVGGYIIRNYQDSTYGIDIVARQGTPVVAAADGIVLYAGNDVAGYGNLLLIQHNKSTVTAYSNNEKMLVQKNALVKAGQQIATVGTLNGRNVLHFEVRVNGKSVNPDTYLPK
ncbi:peptidoglycan DD-metalloendopeptidase family protein [Kingella negevensis]|uniref:peptidoglycan DD-metalloendopeptidase family protein n=1 Tax=Kingella negevensis TaxID=1522312 RepID=UPI00050A1828|nr:M23 family metallopeptidase [Kingella negevensis]MDK4687795.1 peptidoglycan DD-metalloendopeptidase family protein [Kingella negevensis]WII91209.1 peptidoglycan DD-metalloendopeptidase family protein [Kingella negevensis]